MRIPLALTLVVVAAAVMSFAQDTSALLPPKGSPVAIIVFEDLQCPDCAKAEPILKAVEEEAKVPLVRHDMPLPMHAWAYDAHIIARYIDSLSPAAGEKYRHWVFTNQISINAKNLRGMSQRVLDEQKLPALPDNIDPKGTLAAKVKADFQLGQRAGVGHTPTIFVASHKTISQPIVEDVDHDLLLKVIDETKAQAEKKK